jgi:hypothetical protein
MNLEKVKLITKNMELLVQALKMEIDEVEKKSEGTIKLEELIGPKTTYIDDYEPDYYEEQ